MKGILIVFFLFLIIQLNAQHKAVRTAIAPKIDGIIEHNWYVAPVFTGFTQTNPYFGQKPLYDTKVWIMYDDAALYVAAFMKDGQHDSILKQLGSRDAGNLNADFFAISIDTYNKQEDAYTFGVYASGVQFERRRQDYSYNAVWSSNVQITDSGWVVEMKIPYSAFRFPKTDKQEWKLQLTRYIRRNREESKLIAEPREANNPLLYWATLQGIENITPPLRLSLTPYLMSGLQTETSKNNSFLINAGADLKYGINESHTLDITLLPDFSQVQSDNKYKNLTAYETVYEEQRPFFKESVDLFNKGSVFYSRRIGKTPSLFYKVSSLIDSTETISKNPTQSQLINALKVSGRNKNGLAIGVLNAITADTYAEIKKADGTSRRILTEPGANYNVFVMDKAFKRGNNIYFTINAENSNVVVGGLTLTDKNNLYQLSISAGNSLFYSNKTKIENLPDAGYKANLSFDKVNGKIKFGYSTALMDKNFNANKIGLTLYNNYFNHNLYLSFNQYEPNNWLLNYGSNIKLEHSYQLTSMQIQNSGLTGSFYCTTKKYTSFWAGIGGDLYNGYDFYEPRISGYFFRKGAGGGAEAGLSTDYRKTFALDLTINLQKNVTYRSNSYFISLSPLGRISNHFSFRYTIEYNLSKNEIGFADIDDMLNQSIFGKRNVISLSNSLTGNYFFKNDLSISLKFRHYFSQGEYFDTYYLQPDGKPGISIADAVNPKSYNFNFNSLTVDLTFSWQFAPGSNLMLIWKNEILNEGTTIFRNPFENINELVYLPQTNTFLIKALYYFDYQYLRKKG